MDKVVHFHIPVDDTARAKKFYTGMGRDYQLAATTPVDENGMPKESAGDFGLYALIADTEGNVVGLWQDVK